MPATNVQTEQVIEAVVSGPGGANRLFTVTGTAQTPMVVGPDDIAAETFTFPMGPALSAGQFHRATASASFTSHVVMVDAVPGWYGMDVLSVEADWDDESGRTEMRVEVRAQAGPGTRVQPQVVGFSATVLAELPAT
jgi:hypothetical protein